MTGTDDPVDYLVERLSIPREEARILLENMEAEHGD
jgi:hypothetical protein